MYTVAVNRNFIARHFLIGGDWGAENKLHAHYYRVEVQLKGEELDSHGYLVDITQIEKNLEDVIFHFKDSILNDLAEFKGLNPSVEHFSRIIWEKFTEKKLPSNLITITILLWENEIAWASYTRSSK